MKYSEIKDGDKRSQYIDQNDYASEKIFASMEENASEAITAFKTGHAIFKGMSYNNFPDIMLTDPKVAPRKSANSTNHYTLLLSNLPSWKTFPKRSESLICSTKKSHAVGYGQVFLVLPFNGAKIGVCPYPDIWDVPFPMLGKTLMTFNDILNDNNVSDYDYESIITTILMYRKEIAFNSGAFGSLSEKFSNELSLCRNKNSIISLLDKTLNPITNGFKIKNISNIPAAGSPNEVWTDSKSYLVKWSSSFYLEHFVNMAPENITQDSMKLS